MDKASMSGCCSLQAIMGIRPLPTKALDADFFSFKYNGLSERRVTSLSHIFQGAGTNFRITSDFSTCALKSNKKGSTHRLLFEKDIFENSININGGEPKDSIYNVDNDDEDVGLIPEDWKPLQDDLHKSKSERKLELRQRELDNVKRKALELRQKRQKIEEASASIFRSFDHEPIANQTIQLLTASTSNRDYVEANSSVAQQTVRTSHRRNLKLSDLDLFTDDEMQCLRGETDLTTIRCEKWPALHVLAASGQFFLLDEFLKSNVDVNSYDEDGYTAIQRAVLGRKETAVSQLLRAGAQLNIFDKDGASLLHLGVQTGSLNLVRLFVKYGVDVNHADENGWTPLHVATLTGREDIVRHLLISGAQKDLKTNDGYTPLDICLALGKGFRSYAIAKALKLLPKVAKTDDAYVHENMDNLETIP